MNSLASVSCCELAWGVKAHAERRAAAMSAPASVASRIPISTSLAAGHRGPRARLVDHAEERVRRILAPRSAHPVLHEVDAAGLRIERECAVVDPVSRQAVTSRGDLHAVVRTGIRGADERSE